LRLYISKLFVMSCLIFKAAGGLLCHFEEANDQSKLVFDEMSERVDGAWDESFRDLGVHAARFDLKYFAVSISLNL
jgi:hypothetical protein